jgi:hypothetical protein
MTIQLSKDGALLTVHVPMAFRERGGRKLMLAPSGTEISPLSRSRVDNALVKAIARAHRWKGMLESGAFASITELAEAEQINQSYLCRVLRLNLLAPDILESALNGTLSPEFTLERAMKPLPVRWEDQRRLLRCDASHETKGTRADDMHVVRVR